MTKTKVMNWLQKNTMILILVLVVLFFTWQTGGKILLPQNITNLIAQNAYVFILATGMLLCILTGGNIDLSVGSVVCFTGAVGALLMATGMNMWLAVVIMLVIGLIIGGLQAFCIAYVHVPPFITTLAGQLIFRGLSNVILNGRTQTVSIQAFKDIFGGGATCYVPDLLGGNGINLLCVVVGVLACVAYLLVTFRNRMNRAKKGYSLEPIVPVVVRSVIIVAVVMFVMVKMAQYKGIPTGFRLLDTVLTGLGRGDLIILAARPGMGKTSFALNIATRVAMQQKVPVAIFSLEMTKEQLTNRILSSEAGIDSQAFRTGALRAEDWEYLALATEKLHDAPIYMDDTSGITITEMKAKIRRVNQDPARPNVGLIVIDYLQLMTSGQRSENRVQEISSITRNLKIMAKEMNVPIIALSQLSRAVEKQGNNSSHRPQLSDLRDSGSIEQDADCVLFLYRDSYYASQNPDGAEVDADTAECIVAKNRHGETSTVPLGWDGAHTRFMDVDFKR